MRLVVGLLIFLPVFFFLSSNILLNSGWAKGKFADKLEEKTGLRWTIGTMNWTPDGKVHVYDARARLGEGELAVEEIDVSPVLGAALRGNARFERMVVTKPRVEVDLEWVRERMGDTFKEREIPGSVLPEVAGNDPESGSDAASDGGEAQGAVEVAGGNEPKAGQAKSERAVPERVVEELEQWLVVRGAEVVVKDGKKVLAAFRDVDCDVPLGGDGLKGFVRCAGVEILEREMVGMTQIGFERKDGVLQVGFREENVWGLRVRWGGSVRVIGSKPYFLCRGVAAEQDVAETLQIEGVAFDYGATGAKGEFFVRGSLFEPSGWAGFFAGRADELRVVEHHREGEQAFRDFRVSGQLARGVLMVPEVRSGNEDLAVLANGYAMLNGYAVGVVRLMGSPRKMQWFTGFKNGAGLFETGRHSLVSQWQNPDRHYVDLLFEGPIQELEWKAKGVSGWEDFWDDFGRMKRFVRAEKKEDEVLRGTTGQ